MIEWIFFYQAIGFCTLLATILMIFLRMKESDIKYYQNKGFEINLIDKFQQLWGKNGGGFTTFDEVGGPLAGKDFILCYLFKKIIIPLVLFFVLIVKGTPEHVYMNVIGGFFFVPLAVCAIGMPLGMVIGAATMNNDYM